MNAPPRSVTPGERISDTLTMTWRILDACWKPSLNGDLTQLDGSVVNQRGETVLPGTATILVMPKPSGEPRTS